MYIVNNRITSPISRAEIIKFQSKIYNYYQKHGRDLPWRKTQNPYHILVSEIMLQQTQVDRCILKYNQFIKQYPDFSSLAKAPLAEILGIWQGLGYNRRALALKKIAYEINSTYNGKYPAEKTYLVSLPSIGKATAASILAFAFNKPEIVIETNIRAVYIHYFFQKKSSVSDTELIPFIEYTLDKDNPRIWYYALMDYGTYLKKKNPLLTKQSSHYKKQSPFKGSDRQIRGRILKILTEKLQRTEVNLIKEIQGDSGRIRKIIKILVKEGFIEKRSRFYIIKD